MIRLGAHMSIAGGHEKSIERGLSVGCETIQIFSKSNNQWDAPPITEEQAERFKQAVAQSGVGPVFAHTAYLINVGSPEKTVWTRSRSALKTEVERATALGLPFIVHHPGSHKETGEAEGIKRIAEAARWVIDQTPKSKVKILFEIAAGQGACIGHRFEHLAEILEKTGHPERTGICLDTCHFSVMGEDPLEVFTKLQDKGLRVPKIQASAALIALSERVFIRPELHDRLRGSEPFLHWRACCERARQLREQLDERIDHPA